LFSKTKQICPKRNYLWGHRTHILAISKHHLSLEFGTPDKVMENNIGVMKKCDITNL
jgi:hypothetical protein